VIFRSDGTIHPGPRNDFGLWSRTGGIATNVVLSTKFVEFAGQWRLGDVDGAHFSLAHKGGKTAMIWRSDGTQHPGPRTDYTTWQQTAVDPGSLQTGDRLFRLVNSWLVGDVDGAHMSIGYASGTNKKTAVIYRSDGTIHPGPRTDYGVWSRSVTTVAGGKTCTKLSTLAENNFNNRGDTTLNTGTTYTYTTSCGYTVRLSGWSHTRNYAKGFLRNSAGTGRAVVEGLKAGKAYNYKIYQYASAFAGTNAYQVNGVSKGSTTSAASDAATATGTAVADSAGKVTFTFTRQTHHIHLSGIAIAEA